MTPREFALLPVHTRLRHFGVNLIIRHIDTGHKGTADRRLVGVTQKEWDFYISPERNAEWIADCHLWHATKARVVTDPIWAVDEAKWGEDSGHICHQCARRMTVYEMLHNRCANCAMPPSADPSLPGGE